MLGVDNVNSPMMMEARQSWERWTTQEPDLLVVDDLLSLASRTDTWGQQRGAFKSTLPLLATQDLEDWARTEALPSENEITRIRRLISKVEAGLDELTAELGCLGDFGRWALLK